MKRDSDLAAIQNLAISLGMVERVKMLYNSEPFEPSHKSVEQAGDSYADSPSERDVGHFVSFIKSGGQLWELEGSRKGPIERGSLTDDEDVLSLQALDMGIKRVIKLNEEGGAGGAGEERFNFSCIALARRP